MTEIYAGTSGFSYKEWKGPFYPESLKESEFLSFYSTKLNTVEVNNTFYRMPKRDVMASWRDQTPDRFRFVIKASRRITHFKRLKDADEPMSFLARSTEILGDQLGAVLYQLPPNLRCSLERLKSFVSLVPDWQPAAIEFRHASWIDESVFDVLRNHNIAIAHADDGDGCFDAPITADWCYLRLRQPDYSDRDLERWAEFLSSHDLKKAMIFFKHETEGAGPRMASSFLEHLSSFKKLRVA